MIIFIIQTKKESIHPNKANSQKVQTRTTKQLAQLMHDPKIASAESIKRLSGAAGLIAARCSDRSAPRNLIGAPVDDTHEKRCHCRASQLRRGIARCCCCITAGLENPIVVAATVTPLRSRVVPERVCGSSCLLLGNVEIA